MPRTPPDPSEREPTYRVAALRLTRAMRHGLLSTSDSAEEKVFAGPLGDWALHRRHLGVCIDREVRNPEDGVVGVGIVIPGNKSGTYERRLEFERFEQLGTAIPVPDLARRLGQYADAIKADGPLTKARGRRLADALREERPALAPLLDELLALVSESQSASRAAEVVATQRDMVGLLMLAHDMERRQVLRDWTGHDPRANFLRGTAEAAHEDDAIRNDWQTLPGWLGGIQVSWTEQRFTKGKRELSIFYGNARKLEHLTGVDLIYYNESHGCFVCVQYKKLREEGTGEWVYRPDQGVDSELARMRAIDEAAQIGVESTDIRAFPTPTFFKLHESMVFEPGSTELVRGMYLSREHFELLLEKNRGVKGGRRIGYRTVPRYMSNSVFASLLGDGWIGTRGAATDLVRDQILRSVAQDRGIVLGLTDQSLGNTR